MKRSVGPVVLVLATVVVTLGAAQVYPPRWYEEEPEAQAVAVPPSLVLADGHLQFPDGTVQKTAPGSGESSGAPPAPSLVLAEGGIEFPDGTVQTTAAGSSVPRTGQTTCYDGAEPWNEVPCGTGIGVGQDGDLQRGAPWPSPRFTINESSPGVPDGTVTDNLTGLIWLRDVDCLGTWMEWPEAMAKSNGLYDGCTNCGGTDNDCGLSDGSVAGQWSLPNVRELLSLVHYGVITIANPMIPNTAGTGAWVQGDPFLDVQPLWYWTSTTEARYTDYAWVVTMGNGEPHGDSKDAVNLIWPVRGGQ